MADVSIEFNLVDNIDELKEATAAQIEKALTAIGIEAVARINPLVPVDTSRLKNSITSEVDERTVYVGTNVEYAAAVEFNEKAHHTTGQAHYIRDGLSNNLDKYKQILQDILSEG